MTLHTEQQLESKYVMPTFGRSPVEFVRGKGMRLEDSEGRSYLDFLSGIGVCSLGHCHPAVVNAVNQQAKQLIHVSNYFYIEHRGEVAEKLSQMLNQRSEQAVDQVAGNVADETENDAASSSATEHWKTFFANSGAEANECAIKLARLWAQKRAERMGNDVAEAPSVIVTLVKSFHGRTLATLAATGQSRFHKGFEPIPEGFLPTPINDLDSLKRLFDQIGSHICAVMIECVQGESGVNVCTPEFVSGVRELCNSYDALMICDEVQCGIFRTGMPFAFQNFGVVPDIVTTAKGIASGIPAGGCSARAHIADVMAPGMHGSTFGGSNIAMAAAQATLSELSHREHAKRILEVGQYLRDQLMTLESVEVVRGLGLMVGCDLVQGVDAHDVVASALKHGLVINATGPSTLRFLPPLICTKEDVDECIDKLTATLADN